MKRLVLVLILFSLLVIEGIAIDLLPLRLLETEILIVPHWLFMFLIVVAIFFDKSHTFYAVAYSIVFGILIDIVYADILGVYMFVYAVSVYIAQMLKRLFITNFLVSCIIAMVTISLVEIQIYIVYSFVGTIDLSFMFFMTHRLLPTVVANLLFFLLVYFIFSKRLVRWSDEELQRVS